MTDQIAKKALIKVDLAGWEWGNWPPTYPQCVHHREALWLVGDRHRPE